MQQGKTDPSLKAFPIQASMAGMFRTLIDSWSALPRATESHLQERIWFDLKATYSPKSQPEMAKDVAAFANALGGALIIGAKAGITEPDYSSPLRLDYATKLESELDEAVRDFCRPSPTVHVRTIPVPTDARKVIVVANVEPFVDQPVAARHESDANTWRFPQRVGRHTGYLLPEQLPSTWTRNLVVPNSFFCVSSLPVAR